MNLTKFYQKLSDIGVEYALNEPMSKHTSFCIGGPADVLLFVNKVSLVSDIVLLANECDVPIFVMGNGSNLLVSDKGIEGAVVKICDETISVNDNVMTCAAGAKFTRVASVSRDNSLKGLEFAWGIPGTVGGAVFMNAGAYGGDVSQVISSCTSCDHNGKVIIRKANELQLGYRTSIFKSNNEVILSADFVLSKGEKSEITAVMDNYMNRRKSKQPLELPSAGSTFKRPEGYFAGALIEESGLKGYRIGGACVSEKHAGFVVNLKDATCDDVLRLIEHVKSEVFKNFGVTLSPEVIFKGR